MRTLSHIRNFYSTLCNHRIQITAPPRRSNKNLQHARLLWR